MPDNFRTHPSRAIADRASTAGRRRGLQVIFFLLGVSLASWVTRTPAIRDALEASTGQMGLVLFGLSIGSMTGILSSGPLVKRLGTKAVITASMCLVIAGMVVLGTATALGLSPGAFAGLLLFGLGMGSAEIATNIDGADVERLENRPLMPLLHGTFSAGAVLGIVFTYFGVGVVWHILGVAVAATAAAATAVPAIPAHLGVVTGGAARGIAEPLRQHLRLWLDRRILLIGCVVLGMALVEGAANDWLPLLMVDAHGYEPASGSVLYAVFATSMTTGRFLGSGLVGKFGPSVVVRTSALCAALGVGLVIFTSDPMIAALGVVLWGLGGSLGFPLAISAAGDGDGDGDTASRVSAVATVGYLAFLVGPPLLGFLGDHFGLRHAMVVVLLLACCAVATASAVRPQAPSPNGTNRAS